MIIMVDDYPIYWRRVAMIKVDYNKLESTPEVQTSTKVAPFQYVKLI